ncbi:MAG TPA: TrbI/VirB10 family protein [Rhizomicrobium sp.]|nr:TrbI/VirB10 family protein [Rhizomicrobium sp.]
MTNTGSHVPPPPPGDPLAVLLPPATRFRRKLVWGLLIGSAIVLAGVFAYGFLHNNGSLITKRRDAEIAANQKPQKPDLGAFPQDYSQIKPAQHAVQPLAAVRQAQATQPPAGRTASGNGQPTETERARASNVFFPQSTGAAQQASSTTVAATAPQAEASALNLYGTQPLPPEAMGGLSLQKNAFLANSGTARDYVAKPIQSPLSPYEIKAGTVIPAALITGINSDLPGEIIAQVSENVFDTVTGRYLLVPQGSRLVGKYDSLISYGQNRALVVWNRLILPNGNSIDLEAMPGTDQSGTAGLEDRTDHHRGAFAGALAVSTLLSLGPSTVQSIAQSGQSGSNTNIYTSPAAALGSNTSHIGENMLNRELNRPNTITVRPGWPLNVLINRDLVMRSYTNG